MNGVCLCGTIDPQCLVNSELSDLVVKKKNTKQGILKVAHIR